MRDTRFSGDASEEKGAENLAREGSVRDSAEERAKHSVFDEPAMLPNRAPVLIEQDWYCRNCGYNLRGLMTGHRCPECGQVERYEPPRGGEETYGEFLASGQRPAPGLRGWIVVLLVPWIGVPLGLLGSLVLFEKIGVLYFVVMGPAFVEIGKIIAPAMLLERGGYAVRGPGQVFVATLGTALVFAAAHNLFALSWHYPGSPLELVAWRWTVSVAMNVLCTMIATVGLTGARRHALRHGQPVAISRAYPLIGVAILIHAVWNLCTFLWGFYGYGF